MTGESDEPTENKKTGLSKKLKKKGKKLLRINMRSLRVLLKTSKDLMKISSRILKYNQCNIANRQLWREKFLPLLKPDVVLEGNSSPAQKSLAQKRKNSEEDPTVNENLLVPNGAKRFKPNPENEVKPIPIIEDKYELKPGKRMIIIDGSNVAFAHSKGQKFSVRGLQICIQHFESMGHEVKAIVPQMRLKYSQSTDPDILRALYQQGKVLFTPCKEILGRTSCTYDDRFTLKLAAKYDAVVISNDYYRDLIGENPEFRKVIESRVVGFMWCGDFFSVPDDPYGKSGPRLGEILNRK